MSQDSEYRPDENVDPQLEETTTVAVKKQATLLPCPYDNCDKLFTSQKRLDTHIGKICLYLCNEVVYAY